MKYNGILFLTLKVFSATGGIEKVCRIVGKTLFEYGIEKNIAVQVYAMHGNKESVDGNVYFPSEMFKSFEGRKIDCIIESVKKGVTSRIVIMSHINLMLIGWLIKIISPSTKIILFAHGIEVWMPLSRFKRMMIKKCDQVLAVSRFTADKLEELHQLLPGKIIILNNCLDPFLPLPGNEVNRMSMRKRYGFSDEDRVIFTLTRLSARERYKGYDNVMHALVKIKKHTPRIRYLLAGSYDNEEKQYIDAIISELDLTPNVVMTGFVADEELAAHFAMSDIYVMPSVKEGFGIVFIEAMYYGLPVIAGNKDGSVDALCNGELGLLVDPLSVPAIQHAIEKMLSHANSFTPDRELLLRNFSYETYKSKLEPVFAH